VRQFRLALATALIALLPVATQAAGGGHAASSSQFPAVAPETVGFDSSKLKLLDNAMDAAVDNAQVAGILIMAARHGKLVDLHMHGMASTTAGTPIARDTIFRLYSQTKPMIGVAMMILYEKGLWKLDDPVSKFIPEFAHLKVLGPPGPDGKPTTVDATRPPTMRELMTHTAGFGYGLRTGNPVDDAFRANRVLQSNGLKEMIDKIAAIPLLYQPGTKWSYSVATDIQGYIIEKLSGETLGQFMRAHIWGPLGMKDAGFYVPEANAARLSGVYVVNAMTGNKPFELTPAVAPTIQDFTKPPMLESGGGGSVSTADDYALFCQMILNHGELNGARILSPEAVAMMATNQIGSGVEASTSLGRLDIGGPALGFGLDFAVVQDPEKLGVLQGKGSIWWGGAAGTWFWIDPKNDLFFLGMVQKFGAGTAGNEGLGPLSQRLLYQALSHPEK
jgi:CubicO group peptidase (beta-lactamase class C family)